MKPRLLVGLWMLLLPLGVYSDNDAVLLTPQERETILSFGSWPLTPQADPSNKYSGNPKAITFGKTLFFDQSLSKNKEFSCATCHNPNDYFTDGLTVAKHAKGSPPLFRNTPRIFNLANNRWFGWGGESDSLWAHSIRPLLSEQEMASTPEDIQQSINNNEYYRKTYQTLTNTPPKKHSSEQVLVNVSKMLAAFQETLVSSPSSFDYFRNALEKNNTQKIKEYSASAQRGLKLFIGHGRCNVCHFGAKFSNGEFADVAIPFFIDGGVDAGRYNGIQTLKNSPYNQLGKFNDNSEDSNLWAQYVRLQHKNWGEFKVPSLRGIKHTAPYMHNGSINTLEDVVNHYDKINEERLHADGEKILRPLNVTQQQREDLLVFLESL